MIVMTSGVVGQARYWSELVLTCSDAQNVQWWTKMCSDERLFLQWWITKK